MTMSLKFALEIRIGFLNINIMCVTFCEEFGGWCKSFTRTEWLLTLLELLLLIIFITFLIFLVLHFAGCSSFDSIIIQTTTEKIKHKHITTTNGDETSLTTPSSTRTSTDKSISDGVACTWKPSRKTKATSHYYENIEDNNPTPTIKQIISESTFNINNSAKQNFEDNIKLLLAEEPDGEEAEDTYKDLILALVKIKPPAELTFGCVLTIVAKYWTLTAASCVEAIEEVDTLESFVMVERYGEVVAGRALGVADLRVHPDYVPGGGGAHDLAALRADAALHSEGLPRADMLDYYSLVIGESLTLFGFGGYRSIDRSAGGVALRAVRVHLMPPAQCALLEGWAARHLWGARGVERAPFDAPGALCAGPLGARGAACNYCAGAPLVVRGRLLALLAGGAPCGRSCDPALHALVPKHDDWILQIIRTK